MKKQVLMPEWDTDSQPLKLAIRLEKMGWGTSYSWPVMQRAYELFQARKRDTKSKARPHKEQPGLS